MKFLCTCGGALRDQGFPNAIGLRIISDQVLDKLTVGESLDAAALWNQSARAVRCPRCGRMHVFWSLGQWPPQEYVPTEADGTIAGDVLVKPCDSPRREN